MSDSDSTSHTVLPAAFLDAHHHYVDSSLPCATFLASLAGDSLKYTPEQYRADVRDNLAKAGVEFLGSVHIEAMPDDGAEEVKWIEGMRSEGRDERIRSIVGSVDLAGEGAADDIAKLKAASDRICGVRWMLDCVGKFDGGKSATHPATMRHDGVDYLRGSDGGYDGSAVKAFEDGFALLAEAGLSFDLQCAPVQLKAAAELFGRHPGVPIAIDHLGKPRKVLGDSNDREKPDEEELRVWRDGMAAMAALPHTYAKISMLGYIIPGWHEDAKKEDVVKGLVLEVVEMFGPERCMVASNWWANAAMSDSDGAFESGPGAAQLLSILSCWFEEKYSKKDQEKLFVGTAKKFYKID